MAEAEAAERCSRCAVARHDDHLRPPVDERSDDPSRSCPHLLQAPIAVRPVLIVGEIEEILIGEEGPDLA
jgi:hypothetical protein